FSRRPRFGQGSQRGVAAEPIVALHPGRIDQSTIGHENSTIHLLHLRRQEGRRIIVDAGRSLVVIDAELVGPLPRSPSGTHPHLAAFAGGGRGYSSPP